MRSLKSSGIELIPMISQKIQSLVFSLDLILALVCSILVGKFIPDQISIEYVLSIFEIAITILSIIFSVYFAALTVIITAGDNQFVRFLEEGGLYSRITWTFKVTLGLLFFALLVSIILFVVTLPYKDSLVVECYWPKNGFIIYVFIATWALFAAALATWDSIKYAEYRARYIRATQIRKDE